MAVTLQESLRGLFYAPFYVALAQGRYAAEGVEVRFVTAPRPGDAANAVMDGTADICWGGPMRVMQSYHRDPACDLVCFAEVVTRDPFVLLGRAPNPGFTPADLVGQRFATVSEVPTPWLCLQHDLRLAGVAPGALTRIADRSMAENCAALLAGTVDVIQVFEPFVSQAVAGGAHVWYAAANRGPTSYTTLYARRGTLLSRRDELQRMVRALHRTQHWVEAATGAEIATAIQGFFPALPPHTFDAACTRYKDLGIWGKDPILPRTGYDRLRDSLVSGGFVDPGAPFEVAVDNSLAQAAISDLSAAA